SSGGTPRDARPPPLGQAMYNTFNVMVANGEAALMVLYDYDFLPCQAGLNRRGQERLQEMQARLARTPFPVVIEAVGPPGLAAARRMIVLQELSQGPHPTAPERVVVGRPLAGSLSGPESEIIYGNLLNQVRSGGLQLPGGGAGTIGAGGPASQVSPQPPVQR